MNEHQIQCVLAVAKHRSFTKAAKELFISQPTLSTNIQKIEESFGIKLFDRSSSPLRLTYAGEIFVNKAREIISLQESLQKELRDISDEKRGYISFGASQSRLPFILPQLTANFKFLYPNIQINGITLPLDELQYQIVSNELNFMVRSFFEDSPALPNELVAEELPRDELVIVANDKYIKKEYLVSGLKNTIDPRFLDGLPFISMAEGFFARSILDTFADKYNIKPKITLLVNDNISVYRLATLGYGIALVPRIITKWVLPLKETPIYSISSESLYLKQKVLFNKKLFIGEPERAFLAELRRTLSSI